MLKEFDIIQEFFHDLTLNRPDVSLGIGDDAALCRPPPGMELVIAADLLNAGIHFPHDAAAADIGYKALAVNLSDMAAMGAEPAWFTLTLSCPEPDADWLRGFCRGLGELARQHSVQLIGGDTTRGPLSVGIHMVGFVPPGQALTRGGAQVGDLIYVTGTLGDAGAGLRSWQGGLNLPEAARVYTEARLHRPTPRLSAGKALRGLAHSAIDVSDGLLADLGHILDNSGVGACLNLVALPLSDALHKLSAPLAQQLALSAGDDYELCFTAPPQRAAALEQALSGTPFCCIGNIEAETGLRGRDRDGQVSALARSGFDHFVGAKIHGFAADGYPSQQVY